jgi:hypothetical protein
VVNFQCDVSIQAPRTQDYPWLANLSKRVKKLDPEFDLKLERQILRSVPAQMVLEPSQTLKHREQARSHIWFIANQRRSLLDDAFYR